MAVVVMSAGAAKGLITRSREAFAQQTGADIDAAFGPVGALREEFAAGRRCDVLILSEALIDSLVAGGDLPAGDVAALGVVRTGLAVGAGDPAPDVSTPDAVRAALLASRGIYLGDPVRSTGGRHLMSVLDRLHVGDRVAPFLRPCRDGTAAMQALAASDEAGRIGCTQTTEVLGADGVRFVGALPGELALATTYTAAVTADAPHRDLARRLVSLLTGASSRALRRDCGFEA